MKPVNNKFAAMFTALAIYSLSITPASATVSKDNWREHNSQTGIAVILDDVGTGGWGVPSSPDAGDSTDSTSHLTCNR